jgi:feruloyl-CoA synthase
MVFDGRVAEDFKLSTGTWVSVGPLRAGFIDACAPYARDVVIAGHDRDTLAVLVFPDLEACRKLAADLPANAPPASVLADARVRDKFRSLLESLARTSTGSSTRIARALLLDTPASLDTGEMTDKGSINQRAVLDNRAALVETLYREPLAPAVIAIGKAG